MSVVEDYCKDKNVPNDIISEIKVVARFASEFSFDILKCLVEEYFIHKISIVELIKDFNIKLFNKETKYNVSIETIKPTSDNKVLIFEDSNKQIVNVEGIYPDTKSYIIYCELVGENEEQNSFVNINVAADNCKTDWENYKPEKYKTLINYKEGIFELTWNKIVRNEEASIFGKKILFKELLACNDV
jgi:ribosomal protein S8